MLRNKTRHELMGTFECSGKLLVTDPCYEKTYGPRLQGIVENVARGVWVAYVEHSDEGSWGSRVAILRAELKGGRPTLTNQRANFTVAVDSGQAGVFDLSKYPDVKPDWNEQAPESFYMRACDRTLNTQENAGVLEEGAVSSSGFGDGCYSAYLDYDRDNKVVGVSVEFIEEEGEETCTDCSEELMYCRCDECEGCGYMVYSCQCEEEDDGE